MVTSLSWSFACSEKATRGSSDAARCGQRSPLPSGPHVTMVPMEPISLKTVPLPSSSSVSAAAASASSQLRATDSVAAGPEGAVKSTFFDITDSSDY